jgi:type IV secretory pathway VirB4 component
MPYTKTIALDEVWDIADLPYGSGILTDRYQFAKIYRLQPHSALQIEIPRLLNDLDQTTSLTFYTTLTDREPFSFLALKESRPLSKHRWLSARRYEKHLLSHYQRQLSRLDSMAQKHPAVFKQPVTEKKLECFLGHIFYSDFDRTEGFTLDKDVRISAGGELSLLSRQQDPEFVPLKFYLVSILDAPYSQEFWRRLWSYPGDFTCAVSLQRIDEGFGDKIMKRTRNLYHARRNTRVFPPVDHLFRYSTLLLYPCEDYPELQQFIEHLRSLGCNVQVQSAHAEECLANFLPPGNPYGQAATATPESLFPYPMQAPVNRKALTCKKPVSSPVRAESLARSGTLCKLWPLVSYDPDSGFLITENHEFTRVYKIESFWDPHIASVNYPVFDRAINQLCSDTRIRMSFYLHREPLDPCQATNPLMYEQMRHLREESLAFKTKGFLTLTYTLPERSLQTLRSMTHEEAWKAVQQKIEEAHKHLKTVEDGFNMIAYDPLKGDRLLEFFNPLLNSKVQSLEYFVQDPLADHYLSEYLLDTDITIARNYVHFNGRYHSLILFLDYPPRFRSDFYKVLLSSFPKQFTVVVKASGLSADQQDSLLSRRQKLFNSATTTGFSAVRNVKSEHQLEEMERAQLLQYAKGVRVFNSQVVLLQSADTLEELQQNQDQLFSKCKLLGFNPLRPLAGTAPLFFTCLPPAKIERSFNRRTETQVLTHLLPVHLTLANQNLADSDICLVDRTGMPDAYKLFDRNRKNQNAVISGATGEGKTMCAEVLIESHLARYPGQTKTIIIDLSPVRGQGSYFNWVHEARGEYVPFSYRTDRGIDIFSRLRKDPANKDELNLVSQMIEYMTLDPKQVAEGHSGIQISQTDAYEMVEKFVDNVMDPSDITLENLIYRYTLRKEFSQCLTRWERFFFNQRVIDMDNPLLCFDYQTLGRDDKALVSMLTFWLMRSTALDIAEARYKYYVLAADELPQLLDNSTMAKGINEAVKTWRKAGGAVLLIAQSVDEYSISPHAQKLVANCAEGFFLRQEYSEQMKKCFKIAPEDWESLEISSDSKKYSEFLRSGVNVNRLYVPPAYFQRRHTDYLDKFEAKEEAGIQKKREMPHEEIHQNYFNASGSGIYL